MHHTGTLLTIGWKSWKKTGSMNDKPRSKETATVVHEAFEAVHENGAACICWTKHSSGNSAQNSKTDPSNMLARFRWFRGYTKRVTVRHRISVKGWDRKLPSATSFLNSWRFLMTQLSTSAPKSTASFGKAESSVIVGYMKQTPQNYISVASSGGHRVSVFSLSAKQQSKVNVTV